MNPIKLLGIVRRVEHQAARRGYSDDCTIDDPFLPDTGTYGQQLDLAGIGLDAGIRLHELSTADRELVSGIVRSCVLGPPRRPATSQPTVPRARRRIV